MYELFRFSDFCHSSFVVLKKGVIQHPPPIGERRKLQTVVKKMTLKFKETLERFAQGESRNLIKSFQTFRLEKLIGCRDLQTNKKKHPIGMIQCPLLARQENSVKAHSLSLFYERKEKAANNFPKFKS